MPPLGSLTSALGKRGTVVREFFESSLPNAADALRYCRETSGPITIPRPEGINAGTLGGAFDYMARRHFARATRPTLPVAAYGALLSGRAGLFQTLANSWDALGRDAPELLVAKHCWALALFDELYRAGPMINSPLLSIRPDGAVHDLLSLCSDLAAQDLISMTRAFADRCPDLLDQSGYLNPTFEGSQWVNADADLIIASRLIDLKTTTSNLGRTDLYQVVGYYLLDFDDRYEIENVGFYLARREALVSWPIGVLVSSLSGDGSDVWTDRQLMELRKEFIDLVISASDGRNG